MQSKLIGALFAVLISQVSWGQTVTSIIPDGKAHKFEARDKQFWIDGQPTMLVAGEMHFNRVLPEDWETRIKQAKAMGLNTISFYLFWNMVEPQEGKFDFTGMTDVRRVIKLCQDNGMWAVLRPGPYCCAEIEYGGIPYWTLKYPNVKIRTADPKWMEWCKRYIGEVYKQVADLQVEKGGPLLMVQLDNEYGITDPDNNDYMVALNKIFKEVGFEGQLFTCNPSHAGEWADPNYRIPGVLHARNGLKTDETYRASAAAIGNYPVFVPEVYTAWFSGWGEPIARRNSTIPEITNWASYLIDHNYSFCLYLFFGGTNFGFDNGSNFFLPVQTSYDYSAPIDEAGRTTEKYRALRKLYSEKLKINPPEPPADPLVIEIPSIKFTEREPLIDTLPDKPKMTSTKPVPMENLDQDYGFVLYRKRFVDGVKGTLELRQAMDYTVVIVNGKTVGKAFMGYGPESNKITLNETGPVVLDLLVYNLGRISVVTSYKTQNLARKGLLDGAYLDGKELTDYQIYSLPYEKVDNFKASKADHVGPTFYRGTFSIDKVGGSFLDMRNWGFGAVWVNGHNLGRYWDRGGVRSLFVPSHWLKSGENEIIVLELHDAPKVLEISGGTKIIEETAVPWTVKLDQAPAPPGGRGSGRRGAASQPAQ
ncbi:MAG TPA: beta-galactosidase [Tepidisphaeraceae bacterium]|nr:beta-galactosidase [Tepidisphaeraceae bacterium]